MLVDMPFGAFPMALGVIYDDPRPTFESAVVQQNAEASAGKTPDLQALVGQGQSWMVTKETHAICPCQQGCEPAADPTRPPARRTPQPLAAPAGPPGAA